MRQLITKRIVLLTVIIFLLLNSIFIWAMLGETEEEFDAVSEIVVNQTASAMAFWMDEQLKFAQTIAESHVLSEFCQSPEDIVLRTRVEGLLKNYYDRYEFYDSMPITLVSDQPILTVVDGQMVTIESGQILADAYGHESIGEVELDTVDIEGILSGKPYSRGAVHISHITNNPVFDLSVPIMADNKIVGIFTLSTHLDYFAKKFVDVHKIGETGYMFIMDSRGYLVAHPDRDMILKDTPERRKQTEEFKALIENGQYRFKRNLMGTTKYYYGKKVEGVFDEDLVHYYIVISQHTVETLDEVFSLSAIVATLTLLAAILLIRMNMTLTEVHTRRQHELQLLDMNKMLEAKVDARTNELKRMAITDGLTGLYNHQYSHDLLNEMIGSINESQLNVCLLLIDLDNFKRINDSYGHQVGDKVLKEVAQIMQKQVRSGDFVGRYGGEEFLVVLKGTDLSSGMTIAERMRLCIEEQVFEEIEDGITISGGLSEWTGESVTELIKKADELLYKAKSEGRNRVVSK